MLLHRAGTLSRHGGIIANDRMLRSFKSRFCYARSSASETFPSAMMLGLGSLANTYMYWTSFKQHPHHIPNTETLS